MHITSIWSQNSPDHSIHRWQRIHLTTAFTIDKRIHLTTKLKDEHRIDPRNWDEQCISSWSLLGLPLYPFKLHCVVWLLCHVIFGSNKTEEIIVWSVSSWSNQRHLFTVPVNIRSLFSISHSLSNEQQTTDDIPLRTRNTETATYTVRVRINK